MNEHRYCTVNEQQQHSQLMHNCADMSVFLYSVTVSLKFLHVKQGVALTGRDVTLLARHAVSATRPPTRPAASMPASSITDDDR